VETQGLLAHTCTQGLPLRTPPLRAGSTYWVSVRSNEFRLVS